MRRVVTCIIALCLLGACSQFPSRKEAAVSACTNDEASYDCQVERYRNVND
jgi:hypothetical protein